ncbi:MAG: hypothetical protein HQL42_09025 [Alphaproteobacteria bacterium]|nr:hypothetical protein [Alphaproteobacteria bacterium]
MTSATSSHTWRFFRAGGFDQVRIDSGADLLALDGLDQKLWVALACPAAGIEFDAKALAILDSDKDGRIRAAEILDAVAWLKSVLKDPEELVRPGDELALAAIDETSPEGARVLASARRILSNLGKAGADTIALADTQDTGRIFAQTQFNGDGVIPPEAAEDAESKALIVDIVTCLGGVPDRSGAIGIDQPMVDSFYGEIESLAVWLDQGAAAALAGLGDDSAAAGEALEAVRDKIDGFFLRCNLAAYSDGAAQSVNPAAETFAPLTGLNTADAVALLAPLPLAALSAGAGLPLGDGLNPAWVGAVRSFADRVVTPLLGARTHLTEAEWTDIKERFADHAAWRAAKPATRVEQLGNTRVLALKGGVGKAVLESLIAQDKALEAEAAAIDAVEKLVVLRLHLYRLVNNFVSFRDFYTRKRKAIFQAGTLFLDSRSAELCVRVDEVTRHAALATLSRIYLVYCECQRRGTNEKMTVMAGFTSGESDQLMVGRNGVFYDRKGHDWDATIVRIVEHPISMRQAFWSPYKQLGRFVGAQVEKMAAARARASEAQMQAQAIGAAASGKAPPPKPAEAPFDVGRFAGIFAAIGLAVGAIGTAIASVITGFLRLPWWQMPLALFGLVLLVSGPSMVIAYMKLRQRSLAPILDATGWAVNARATINIPFGGSLTQVAHLPAGAERSLADPFAERRRPWGLYLLLTLGAAVAAFALWKLGLPASLWPRA